MSSRVPRKLVLLPAETSSFRLHVGRPGLEPGTCGLKVRRAANCASGPSLYSGGDYAAQVTRRGAAASGGLRQDGGSMTPQISNTRRTVPLGLRISKAKPRFDASCLAVAMTLATRELIHCR